MAVWLPACVFLCGVVVPVWAASAASRSKTSVPPQYQTACVFCHQSGRFGAPRTGVPGDWSARLKEGMSTLVKHVKEGYNAMPAGGLCGDCSDQDYRALIRYMSTQKKDKS
jgi:cytochrome c5